MPEAPSAPCEGLRDDMLEEPRLSDGLRLPGVVMLCFVYERGRDQVGQTKVECIQCQDL